MPSRSRALSRKASTGQRLDHRASILDYVFRELRFLPVWFDLAHVEPSESGFDALGKGVEGKASGESKYVSKGLRLAHRQAVGGERRH
jgi:hypothetical protein